MLSTITSAAIIGVAAKPVDVEVDVSNGFPCFSIVGLGDAAIQESRQRIRSAIRNSGLEFPTTRRLTVNLAPAYVKKEGAWFDLPIAVGILAATGVIPSDALRSTLFLGELSLDGSVRPVAGVVPAGLLAASERIRRVFIAAENAHELFDVSGISVIPVHSLREVVTILHGGKPTITKRKKGGVVQNREGDFGEIHGHEDAKRVMMIAAVGRHHISLSGPPGIGKSLLANAFPSVLPDLPTDARLEVATIYSSVGRSGEMGTRPPFRAPHHSTSVAAMLGGGRVMRPGEMTLAHRGVLFLDEIPEFPRNVLEALRQPLEERTIRLARAGQTYLFPADVQLIVAANPCACGWFGSEEQTCTCPMRAVMAYQNKLSGPLTDRIDIALTLNRPEQKKTASSEEMRAVVHKALAFRSVRKHVMTKKAEALLREVYHAYALTARGYEKTVRIARSIADLELSEEVRTTHVAEALSLRGV